MNDFSDCTCVDQIQHISLGSGGSASNEKRYMTRKNQSPNTWWFMVLNRKKMIHVWYNGISTKKIKPSCKEIYQSNGSVMV